MSSLVNKSHDYYYYYYYYYTWLMQCSYIGKHDTRVSGILVIERFNWK